MKDIKVVFMGTPSFAVPILESLIEKTNVVMVVTQPDRGKGKSRNKVSGLFYIFFSPDSDYSVRSV